MTLSSIPQARLGAWALPAVALLLAPAAARAQATGRVVAAPPTRPEVVEVLRQAQVHLTELERSHQATAEAAEKLAVICKGLGALIDDTVKAADAAVAAAPGPSGREELAAAVQRVRELQTSYNLQYLMLQNVIAHESRQFSMVSNIMKTKHDTAKNAINNIR